MAAYNWPINPAVVNSGPVQFVRNGIPRQVTEDTVTPGNNLPLPVKLTSVTGDINITAGDLNVQLSDVGPNPDITRIGDGTNRLVMTASGQATVAVTSALPAGANTIGAVTQSGTWNINNITGTVPLPTGAATETTLAALNTKVPAQGAALTAASLPVNIASDQTVPVSGPLTDAQLRAVAVPVSGPLTDAQLRASAVVVSGPLTDAQLRAAAVPVSAASLPLPTGAATEATLAGLNNKVAQDFGLASGAVRTAAQVGNASGAADFGAGTVSAQTLRVIIASDQSAIPVNTGAGNTAGSHTTATVGTTAATASPPANAVGFFLQASDQNAANLRWAIGATASSTVGTQLQPGRATVFVPVSANISIVSESGTNEYQLQWVRSS